MVDMQILRAAAAGLVDLAAVLALAGLATASALTGLAAAVWWMVVS